MSGKVIVVGGGVVGASCAYELALRGWRVRLLDASRVGGGCSQGNCGYVCPSHVYPLARPGTIASTLPLVFRRNSPFAVRARLDLPLLAWFNAFRRCCTEAQVEATMGSLHDLLAVGKARYEEVIRAEGIDAEYEQRGCLFISKDESHLEHFEADNRRMTERFGYGARRIDGRALAALEPTLREGLGGAWMFDCDAHLRPDRYMAGLRAALLRRGVVVCEGTRVVGIEGGHGVATGVATEGGVLEADEIVIATGAWTPGLERGIGARLPIVPGKGYSVTLAGAGSLAKHPMVFEQHRVAVTPFRGAARIGSTMEFAGFDASIHDERLRLLTDSASLYFKEPVRATREGAWFGWRPMVPDGKPFIGRAPKYRNVMVAAGHSMIGMSTGPGTGRVVAQMLSGEPPAFDPGPFRIGRRMG